MPDESKTPLGVGQPDRDELVAELSRAGFTLKADGVYCGDTLVMDRPILERQPSVSAVVRKASRVWNCFVSVQALEQYLKQ